MNVLFLLVAFFVSVMYGCGDRMVKRNLSSDPKIDFLEDNMLDSAYSNVEYSRKLLRERMVQTSDSADYYRLIALYGKSFFPSADYDSVDYYFGRVRRFLGTSSHYSPYFENSLLTDIYTIEGNVQMALGRFDSATVCYEHAYYYCRQSNRTTLLPDICINLADAWSFRNRYDLTSHYYRRALFLCDSLELPEQQKIPVYYGLGHTYMSLRNFTLCDHYFGMADSLLPQMKVSERFTYYNNRGNSYYYRKDYSTALQYMRKAFATVAPYQHLKHQQELVKGNLGELFLLDGDLDSARLYIDESYDYFDKTGNRVFAYYLKILQMALALKTNHLSEALKS